jgi:hypothetical protein
MKQKKFLIYAMMSLGSIAFAQTPNQREVIKKSINKVELERLEQKFQKDYELQEAKVFEYLKANPSVERSFTKDGSLYYLRSIDENGNPLYINTKSNVASGQLIKANSLYSGGSIGANITGTGMVAGVWDGGQVRASHELLSGKAIMQANQTVNSTGGNDHMTHVTGTIVGKELTSNGAAGMDRATARGIAYNATAQCYDWDNDETEMAAFAGQGYLISNHSYGMGNGPAQPAWTFGAYDNTAVQWDALLKTTPNYLPFVAGGNEQASNGSGKTGTLQGYDVITGSSSAKNVVTVGSVNADRTMSTYSNFGPTDDGRIKPDICTRGTGINSSKYTNDTSYSGDGDDSSGTSYASPAAAAAALLLQQYYFSLNNSYMSASMLKAILLHSADDEGTTGPDAKFGWGILNIERAAQIIKDDKQTGKARLYTFTTNPINNSSSEVNISGIGTTSTTPGLGNGSVKASICWTDDEGIEQTQANGVDPTASRLVYNFDVIFRNFTVFQDKWPYKNLTMANPTATVTDGTGWFQNNVDNYKQVNLLTGNSTGDFYRLYMRKSTSSPAAVRNVSVVITGLAQSPALSNNEFVNQQEFVFYSKEDNKIKLISNNNESFNLYKIYDISGRMIASGHTNSYEIPLDDVSSGIYIIHFGNETNKKSVKFIKN